MANLSNTGASYWEKSWFQFAILLLLAFIWGSSFILMKIGIQSFSSEQAAGIRMLLAGVVLSPIAVQNLRSVERKDIKSLLVVGFIGSFIPAFLFTKAQTQIDSALAGMLNSLVPVFTLIVGAIFYKTTAKGLQILGLIVGLVGAAGLIVAGKEVSLDGFNSYALLIVLATILYAFNINEVKAKLSHLKGSQITAMAFFFTLPASILYLLTTDFQPVWVNPEWPKHLLALCTLGIIGTAFAVLLINTLIQYISAIYASSVTYVIPVFAIFWGILDGELITMMHIGCMAFILMGVFLINSGK